jgi:glutathione S-transferase
MMQSGLPVFYSFRRCPYAMRARMAILASGLQVELREIVLRDKPAEMVTASPKGTVPVLVLRDGRVIDESLDIMLWALGKRDPDGWLPADAARRGEMLDLIATVDADFKPHLDAYKYAAKGDQAGRFAARGRAGEFLKSLDKRLHDNRYLFGRRLSLGDVAVFPFVRQFALVDKDWFDRAGWLRLAAWLDAFLGNPCFLDVMGKVRRWEPGQAPVVFGGG